MNEQPPAKPRNRKKWIWLSIAVSFFLLQFLNFSGFCYSDLRWYSKRQLVDIYLFGREGLAMSEAEKIKKIAEEQGGVYPDCCRLNNTFWPDEEWLVLLRTVFGHRDYGMETHFPEYPHAEVKYSFREKEYSLNACGQKNHGSTGSEESKQEYLNSIHDIKFDWSE